jgi:hypothetical protein
MPPDKKRPATRTGAVEKSYLAIGAYSNSLPTATEIAALVVAQRFGISPPLARSIVELADLGGRLA